MPTILKNTVSSKRTYKGNEGELLFLNNADAFQLFDNELTVKTPEEVEAFLADVVVFMNSALDDLVPN